MDNFSKSANQLWKESNTTLSFKDWLDREKQKGRFIPNKKFGLDDLIYKLINKRIPINVFKHKGYWLDIGRPKDFEKANNDFSSIKSKFLNV